MFLNRLASGLLGTLMIFACATGLVGCATVAPRPSGVAGVRDDDPDPAKTLANLVDAHNKEREKEDLPALEVNKTLKGIAQAHADDMAKHEKMDHKGSDGSTPFERMKKAGYRYENAGENVAYGQRGLDDLMKAWMTSKLHKKNILGKFTEIGAAYAISEGDTPYWCVTFGTPFPE